jgi:hypothetical protein
LYFSSQVIRLLRHIGIWLKISRTDFFGDQYRFVQYAGNLFARVFAECFSWERRKRFASAWIRDRLEWVRGQV